MLNESQLKDVVFAYTRALEQGDWTEIESHPGLYDTRQHFPALLNAIPDMQNTVDHIWAWGNMVATVVTCHGTHQGALMGVPATGKTVSFMVIGIDVIEDDKIVQHWALPDWLTLFYQIGATVQPEN